MGRLQLYSLLAATAAAFQAPAAPRTTTALGATRQGWLAGSMNYVDVEPREAAWKEKWSAASAANVEQRAHTRDAAARVADDVRAYVPPLGGRVAGAVDEFAADETAMSSAPAWLAGNVLGEQAAAERALATMERERVGTEAPAKARRHGAKAKAVVRSPPRRRFLPGP